MGLAFIEKSISVREAWLDAHLAELSEAEREVLWKAADIIDRRAGN